MNRAIAAASAALAASSLFAGAASARDQIRIVGSSTVYPFTTIVAEAFGKNAGGKTPVVESTGTGGGFKLFCAGVGVEHPDATNASRAIKKGEFEDCQKNGVKDVVELKVGIDGLVMANAKGGPALTLTQEMIFKALAKEIPDKDGKLVANPNKTWKDVDASLPDEKIEVLGPPPTSGTRDSFMELVMEKGAEKFPALKAMKDADKKDNTKTFEKVWKSMREDGAWIDAGENDNLIVQKLEANPNKTWKDVDASLPDEKIEVLGPPPTSGTRDSFMELVMEKGAEKFPALKAMKDADKKDNTKTFEKVWKSMREDGAWIDAGENDNLIVQKLEANPKAVGVFGYSFLEENTAKIKGVNMAGIEPTYETISSGKYPVSRPLFVYVKKAHVGVIPGLKEFVAEYTADKAIGEDGYLAKKGLVPLPEGDRKAVAKTGSELAAMSGPSS